MGQDHVSGGVSVLSCLAACIGNVILNFPELGYNVKNGNKAQFGNKVIIY